MTSGNQPMSNRETFKQKKAYDFFNAITIIYTAFLQSSFEIRDRQRQQLLFLGWLHEAEMSYGSKNDKEGKQTEQPALTDDSATNVCFGNHQGTSGV